MDLELRGRVALIAGGTRGLGRAATLALAREGALVAPLGRDPEVVEATCAAAREAGAEALGLVADLTDVGATDAALERLREAHGAPTILVYAAASRYRIQKLHTVDDASAEAWLALDLEAAARLCRRLVADMMVARYGRVVLFGSMAGRAGVAGGTLYSMHKAGLEGLARGLSVDYARRGVTANVCNVGIAETERVLARIAGDPEARRTLERATATRTLPRPEDVADVVAFLCSPRAAAITGAVIDATSGAHLNNNW